MILCKLILTDWTTKKVTKKSIMPKDPSMAAQIHSRNNPNCNVELTYEKDGKEKIIALPPYDMVVDQNRVDEGEMSINRFTTKWFGKISKSKLKQIEREIAKEFVEEEEPVDEEMIID